MAGAAGDCIGFHAEGRAPPVSIPEGEWRVSDDTLLTLATCEGILRGGGVTPEAIAAGLVDAFRRRRIPGLGASTLRALRALDEGAHWAAAGRPGERAAGNGAAMRIAPLALFVTGESEEERRLVRDVCRITHKNDEAYVAALAVIRALHLGGEPGAAAPDAIGSIARALPDTCVRDAMLSLAALGADADEAVAAEISGTSGYAVESVPLAIFLGLRWRDDAGAAIQAAVRCGGDTDTIASIAGQIAGAAGAEIPDDWAARIPLAADIRRLAADLASLRGE